MAGRGLGRGSGGRGWGESRRMQRAHSRIESRTRQGSLSSLAEVQDWLLGRVAMLLRHDSQGGQGRT